SVANVTPSPRFRAAARERLMLSIGAESSPERNGYGRPVLLTALRGAAGRRTPGRWLVRSTAGLIAALLAVTATLRAWASALPGDPLYGVKQAQEELSVRLAGDDESRVLAHLHRADARLDETARLLGEGRTIEAVQTAQRYDQSVERATTTYVVTIDTGD